jgi:hypothetical protein
MTTKMSFFSVQRSAFSVILLFSMLFLITQNYAQSNPVACGVLPNATEQANYAAIMDRANGISSGPQQILTEIPLNASIPIYFWINGSSASTAPTAGELQGAVNRLNTAFHFPNNAHFTLCGQSYINDSRYHTLSANNYTLNRELYGAYHKDNVINVYLTQSVDANWSYLPLSPVWGYLPAGPQMIVLQSISNDSDSKFAHEVGHCLGLLHTFNETYGTIETERESYTLSC